MSKSAQHAHTHTRAHAHTPALQARGQLSSAAAEHRPGQRSRTRAWAQHLRRPRPQLCGIAYSLLRCWERPGTRARATCVRVTACRCASRGCVGLNVTSTFQCSVGASWGVMVMVAPRTTTVFESPSPTSPNTPDRWCGQANVGRSWAQGDAGIDNTMPQPAKIIVTTAICSARRVIVGKADGDARCCGEGCGHVVRRTVCCLLGWVWRWGGWICCALYSHTSETDEKLHDLCRKKKVRARSKVPRPSYPRAHHEAHTCSVGQAGQLAR